MRELHTPCLSLQSLKKAKNNVDVHATLVRYNTDAIKRTMSVGHSPKRVFYLQNSCFLKNMMFYKNSKISGRSGYSLLDILSSVNPKNRVG